MSTRSGACVWWSNARDRADRGGFPRRGVTSRNYTGSCCCHRAVGRLAALLWTTRPPWRPPRPESRVGRLREAQDGGTGAARGFSLESFAGASPPPAEMAKALEIPRAFAVFRDSRPWIWGPAATLGSTNGVNTVHASRCGGQLGVVSAAATHLHNPLGETSTC